MTERHLHIISFDVPFPPDYGGIIDVYYRIRALAAAGIRIHLHCFEYGRKKAPELDAICEKVYYYHRHKSVIDFFSSLPFIVKTRINDSLINNLLLDNYPILMEGLHTSYYLNDERLKGRRIVVRSHNIEHDYYQQLATLEKRFFRKHYFIKESEKLKKYEPVLQKAGKVAAISLADTLYIIEKYDNGFYLPAFHASDEITSQAGSGNYALYHGNLSVGENNAAAVFLLKEVFSKLDYPFVIAGNHPSSEVKQLAAMNKQVTLIENPDTETLQDLIRQAHVNVLPAFQTTGIKLKLINALYNGRYCLVNPGMIAGTGLDKLCIIADTAENMINEIIRLKEVSFTSEMIEQRRHKLSLFDNRRNSEVLINLFFQG